MNTLSRLLLLEQLDKKFAKLAILKEFDVPQKGWVNAIRTSLNMSLAQLAKKMKKTPASVKEMEDREKNKSITLKKLVEIGDALDLQLVYGFIPKESSMKNMIKLRAYNVAREIVMRTSHTMALEDQQNSEERLNQAIKSRAELIMQEMPRNLWD
jgi:predicted DNA-binding mobile mystery protein A